MELDMTGTLEPQQLLTAKQREQLFGDIWGVLDPAVLDDWTEATGLDLAERAVRRLLALNESHEREIEIYCFVGSDWERGDDKRYTHRDRTTQGVKFRHSCFTRTLEIRVSLGHACIANALIDGDDWSAVSVMVEADRLGQNGKVRNGRVTLGYRTGGECGADHFVACEEDRSPRSVAIYRAMGLSAQAEEIQREIDSHLREIVNTRRAHQST